MTAKRGRPPKVDKLSDAERARRYRQRKVASKITPDAAAAHTIGTLQQALARSHDQLREREQTITLLNHRLAESNERVAQLTDLVAALRASMDVLKHKYETARASTHEHETLAANASGHETLDAHGQSELS